MEGSTRALSQARASLIRALHRRKGRQEDRAFLAEGERLLDELAARPDGIRFLFGTSDRMDWLVERFPGLDICRIEGEPNRLFATENAQGVGAVIDMPAPRTLAEVAATPAPILFLDGLADPGNVGTIVRTAEWFGSAGVLLGNGSVDLYNPKVVRGTMGAIFRLPVAQSVAIDDLFTLGLPLVALDIAGTERLGDASLPFHAIYVVGSEAYGISEALLQRARLLRIGGRGEVESLNAAIATGILLYEITRGQS